MVLGSRFLVRLGLAGTLLATGCSPFDSCPTIAEIQPALDRLPSHLSETGLFESDGKQLAAGVVQYTPGFQLWSDGAEKRRFIFLPEGAVIDVSDPDDWQFPKGTKVWKEFTRDGVRVETRLLFKYGDGAADWAAAAYLWNDANADADLAPLGLANARGTGHDVPPADRCMGCHAGRAGRVLGFSALQLGNAPEGSLSLDDLARWGWLSGGLPSTAIPGSPTERAALGYLHANCSHCHNQGRPESAGPRCYDPENGLHMFLVLGELGTVGATPTYRTVVDAKIKRGDPDASQLFELVSSRSDGAVGTDQMPPLATERVDTDAVALLRRWIAEMRGD